MLSKRIAAWIITVAFSILTTDGVFAIELYKDELYTGGSYTLETPTYDPVNMHYPVSIEDARAAIEVWNGGTISTTLHHMLQVIENPGEDSYVFYSTDGIQAFEVSEQTGEVIAWCNLVAEREIASMSEAPPTLDPEIMDGISTEFLRNKYSNFDMMGMQRREVGSNLYCQKLSDGTWVIPNQATVYINQYTQQVYKYRGYHLSTLGISTTPGIGASTAEAIADSYLRQDPDILYTSLINPSFSHVGLDRIGAPRLLWAIEMYASDTPEGLGQSYQIEVDAQTGEVLYVGGGKGTSARTKTRNALVNRPQKRSSLPAAGQEYKAVMVTISGIPIPTGRIAITDGTRY